MKYCYLQLGSNMGNRKLLLEQAVELIQRKLGSIIDQSKIYETAAWGNTEQASFLNVVIKIKTNKYPLEILALTQEIEQLLERKRIKKWGPRTMDIDILFYGYEIVEEVDLQIPHPLIQERRFVLQPMSDISGGFIHPSIKKSINTLLLHCKDTSEVKEFNE